MVLLTLFVALILPVCAFLALVSGKIKLDVGMLQQQIIENLSAEDRAMLESIESTMLCLSAWRYIAAGMAAPRRAKTGTRIRTGVTQKR